MVGADGLRINTHACETSRHGRLWSALSEKLLQYCLNHLACWLNSVSFIAITRSSQSAAQRLSPTSGIWRDGGPKDIAQSSVRDQFRRLASLRCLITTGCNIPLFLGGNPNPQAINSSTLSSTFEWLNYYDADDILGWPLADLSPSYAELVEDIKIQSGGTFIRETPLSHGEYWHTDEFQLKLV